MELLLILAGWLVLLTVFSIIPPPLFFSDEFLHRGGKAQAGNSAGPQIVHKVGVTHRLLAEGGRRHAAAVQKRLNLSEKRFGRHG
jgi:hypothetical protein